MPLYHCLPLQRKWYLLGSLSILLPNFTYQFEIVIGERCLSDSKKGFILPLYLVEAGFHLPLHPFFLAVLQEADGKLARALIRKYREPFDFFYTIYNIPPYRCLTSTPEFIDESSGRDLVENVTNPTVSYAGPTHLLPLTPLSQPKSMDVEALFESVQQAMDIVDSRMRAGSSSRKRFILEKGSSSAKKSS
ncbi:hypothetical protein J1N35_019173 [Gossypium stocksii]|uniref:Uncharacterized protein n=1 Tax=Gossypium stocksii TaxID=47602 RepID=A0A9D4A7U8_9ROSI|nr:hypothetical protein J1N35_019173 [Gossypium stocksii]